MQTHSVVARAGAAGPGGRPSTWARWLIVLLLATAWPQTCLLAAEPVVLARVESSGPPQSFGLAAHAFLQDAAGGEYLLVFNSESELGAAGWPYQIIDPRAAEPGAYILAIPRLAGAREAAKAQSNVLLDDGTQLLIRATAAESEQLTGLGLDFRRLTAEPIRWSKPGAAARLARAEATAVMPQSVINQIIAEVKTTNLFWMLRRLTGEEVILARGEACTLTTRATSSGQPLARALQYARQRLQALGLDTRFHNWTLSGYSNSNLVATQRGSIRSNEYVLVTAHLDDAPFSGRAPGADDNASGSAAVLAAASILSQHLFDRSIRYVLFTGEEQGLLGSIVYANAARAAGDNIVGVLNLDMLTWERGDVPIMRVYTRRPSDPGYSGDLQLASLFTNLVRVSGLSEEITPVIMSTGMDASDHAGFWYNGYPAVALSEDYETDFNPYYHSINDSITWVTWDYYTAITRAVVGAMAQLASPLESVPHDVIQVTAGNWTLGSIVGGGSFHAKLLTRGDVTAANGKSVPWSDAEPPVPSRWLKPFTQRDEQMFQTDARLDAEETHFLVQLGVSSGASPALATPHAVQFEFLTPPRPESTYLVRITLDPLYSADGTGWVCETNLRPLIEQGGTVILPNLANASNGVVYGTCELIVSTVPGPSFVLEPENMSLLAGSPATLAADARGLQPLEYQWLWQGAILPGATNPVLSFDALSISNAGEYSIRATNASGSVTSSPAMLRVAPSIITAQPQGKNLIPGATATFSVSAIANLPMTYQWLLNGVALERATNASLTITNAQLSDGGEYSVVVSNAYGSVTSEAARLLLLIKPSIVQQPCNAAAPPGGSVTLSVAVTNLANLPIGYRWRQGTTTLTNMLLNQHVCFFTIANVQASTNYSVVVSNIALQILSSTAVVSVLPDADHDGLPDDWESAFGVADAAADNDGDGLSNLQEYFAGTDPTDAGSCLKLEPIAIDTGGLAHLRFNAAGQRTYTIRHRDLSGASEWQTLALIPAASSNRILEWTDPVPFSEQPRRFYQLTTPSAP